MKLLSQAVALLIAAAVSILPAQTPAVPATEQAPAEPLVADVHSSPYRSTIYYRTNIGNQRFDMRDATLLDMISLAYNREDAAILGGPTWIDFDHFDVVAKVTSLKPSSLTAEQASTQTFQNPYDQIRPVLKRVLAERFHLTYHKLTEVCTLRRSGMCG
jgi:uncharacterized protein (TIGR03435 family)